MDFKKKINFFEKNKFFCELIEKNNEGLEIIRGLIIFVLDILMNYNTNFFMFFFDIDADTKKYNLLFCSSSSLNIFIFFLLLFNNDNLSFRLILSSKFSIFSFC